MYFSLPKIALYFIPDTVCIVLFVDSIYKVVDPEMCLAFHPKTETKIAFQKLAGIMFQAFKYTNLWLSIFTTKNSAHGNMYACTQRYIYRKVCRNIAE